MFFVNTYRIDIFRWRILVEAILSLTLIMRVVVIGV